MKKKKFTPNLITGFLSILIGIFIILEIPNEVENPVLIFGQSSSEIDPELVPFIVSIMLIFFGSYTMIVERKSLLNNHTLISYEVLGQNKSMQVSEICRQATSKSIWAQFLYLITKKNQSPYFLEVGTNLGVSGSYILEALKSKSESNFITLEGLPQLCQISNDQFFKISSSQKYTIVEGLYEKTFPELFRKNINFNILFIDGNHRKDATLEYFNNLKSHLKLPAVFIFDDINWSDEMKQAWKMIKSDSDVSYSIDMFKLGIIIINKKINKFKAKHYYLHLAY